MNDSNIKSPTFINVAFVGNRANSRGGAISADVSCNFKCNYCLFEKNSCAKKGGAIYLDFSANPEILNSEFINNYAHESGACVAADGGSMTTFVNTKFMNNSARMEGGCLYSGSGVKQGVDQGFEINAYRFPISDIFDDNHIADHNPGQSDIYVWPYSHVSFSDISDAPTPEPTSEPTVLLHDTPNFLIFMMDDVPYTQTWDNLLHAPGVDLYGHTVTFLDVPTPNIDAFMGESITFPRSYSNPKCSPSRYSLLTGRQAVRSECGMEKAMKTDIQAALGTEVTVPYSRIWGADATYNIPNILKPTQIINISRNGG